MTPSIAVSSCKTTNLSSRAVPLFGWGFTDYPYPSGQKSIDNQFLWTVVAQGYVGFSLFVLIVAGAAVRLLHLASRPLAAEDKALVYAHMAVLDGPVRLPGHGVFG